MSQDAQIDKLVLEYLEKRGLTATSRQLKAESQSLAQQMSLAPQRGSNGVVSDLLYYIAGDSKPAHYARSFDSLASWVDNSLDMYRFELSQILYPVFIHCCLKLVNNEASSEATQLISRHAQRFTNVGGQPSKVRMQELNELQAVSMPEHLATNRIAQALQKTRYPVTLSTYSHQLLMHFLQGARLYLILGIVNDNLKLEVAEGQPRSMPPMGEKEMSLLSGQMEAGVAGGKLAEVNLNLLQGLAEDKVATARAAAEAEDIPEVDEDGKPLTKKERTARQRAAAKEREVLAVAEANRMEAEIPLPSLTEDVLEEQMADIEARVYLSSQALPSACFFTFVNTHQSLNCATFTSNGSHVAGGFADASVRVYDIEKASAGRESMSDDTPGPELMQLHGHSGAVFGVDFSRDGQLLFSASADGTVRLWHMELAACLNFYRGHNYPVWDVAAGPFGHYFASAGADRTARVWSVERNQALRILTGHYTDVDVVRWHPNAHYLATGSSDHTIRLWDVRDGQAQRTLIGHRAAITAVAFHPDGVRLASADEDGAIIQWDLAQASQLGSTEQHKGAVWSLSYSRGEGNLLAAGGTDNSLRLWDASSPSAEAKQLPLVKSFHTKATPVFCTQFTPRNLLLGSGSLTLGSKKKPKP